MDFYIHVLLHAAYFWFCFLILFLSFPETNLGSAEKASVEDEGRLLTDCAYEALTLWACMFLKLLKCKFTCFLSGATGYCFNRVVRQFCLLVLLHCPNH